MNALLALFWLPASQRRPWPFGLDRRLMSVIESALKQRDLPLPQGPGQWITLCLLLTARETQAHSFPRAVRASLHMLSAWRQRIGRHVSRTLRFHLPHGLDPLLPAGLKLPGAVVSSMLVVVAALSYLLITTPMEWRTQVMFSAGMLALAILLQRYQGRLVSLLLIFLSLIASCRYFWWRVNHTLDLDSAAELFIGLGLFAAELYSFAVLLLGYLQTAWPLRRPRAELPADRSLWPTVDVFIPTYNESLDVVKPTVLAAQSMEWPADKLNVYVLDDGRRSEHREFAETVGAHYITRSDNRHAKAGNLNHALEISTGEFVAIFDCDHIPVRSFLTETMGWFLADKKCALIQTPHHFFSPDPIERNLHTFHRVPNEGRLFYGLVMDGNDLWNASYFCGSCAVLRRGPLLEVGGIAVETVTEDAHTALKLHRRGYTSAYINKILAAGLATESLAGHIGQRIRWARGMAQIFATDNPLGGRGLSLFQRLCYSNAMLHFFHGLPRIVFLTSPLAFLYLGLHIFNADAVMVAAYVIPHLLQAVVANAQIQSRVRHPYWAEVYESLLAWYVAIPTTLALINPRFGSFNVTDKGGQVARSYFDWRISRPLLLLAVLLAAGIVMGLLRLFVWRQDQTATVVITTIWAVYNLLILGAAIGVAREGRQIRHTHRVDWEIPVVLQAPGHAPVSAMTENVSLGGVRLVLQTPVSLPPDTEVVIALPHEENVADFRMQVVSCNGSEIALEFMPMDMDAQRALIQSTFGRPDAWLEDEQQTHSASELRSLITIWGAGVRGYLQLLTQLKDNIMRHLRTTPPQSVEPGR